MPTRSWVSLLFAVNASFAPLPDGGKVVWSSRAGKTVLGFTMPGSKSVRSIQLARDASVATTAPVAKLKVVGQVKNGAVILVDTYDSLPGGLSYCQAGEESFLRVISLAARRPKESLRLKVGSCRAGVELADDGLHWDPAAGTLQVHWLMGPAGDKKPEDRTYHIGGGGLATKP